MALQTIFIYNGDWAEGQASCRKELGPKTNVNRKKTTAHIHAFPTHPILRHNKHDINGRQSMRQVVMQLGLHAFCIA